MDFKEIAFNHIEGEHTWTASGSERKWFTKIKKAAARYPKKVIIKRINKDGSFVAEIPDGWIKFSPPRVMSEKNKAMARERMTGGKTENKT